MKRFRFHEHWFWDEEGNHAGSDAYEELAKKKKARTRALVEQSNNTAMMLGYAVKAKRLALKHSRTTLALKADVAENEIAALETNGDVTLSSFLRIASALSLHGMAAAA